MTAVKSSYGQVVNPNRYTVIPRKTKREGKRKRKRVTVRFRLYSRFFIEMTPDRKGGPLKNLQAVDIDRFTFSHY